MDDPTPAHARFLDWADRYEHAWRSPGTDPLADLFTPDAVYLHSPYAEAVVGLDAIAWMWEDDRDGPDEAFSFTREVVAVEGPTGVLRCVVLYGDPVEQEYTDLWVVTLADDDRCVRYEEWPFWPGAPYTARP